MRNGLVKLCNRQPEGGVVEFRRYVRSHTVGILCQKIKIVSNCTISKILREKGWAGQVLTE
jgi:hypothetical protein